MAYKSNWATGDLIDATVFQELVNSAVYSFANLTAIQNNITSAVDGQIAFAQDTESYYRYDADSTSWVALLGGADITAVTITTATNSGLSGGSTATSGAFTSTLLMDANNLSVVTASSSDYIVLHDVTDNSTKKALISDIVALGDITAIITNAGSGLSGGATSGDVTLEVDINGSSSVTPQTADEMLISDVTDSNAKKKITLNDLPISSATQSALDDITAGTTAIRTDIAVTVADNGSGSQNEYFFEGAQDQVINLTTGFKYRFDQSNASNSGHPLRFSTTKDGTHASGSEFTDNVTTNGTAGQTGAYTQIEVKADTPERLYVYCTSHAGMGGDSQLTAGAFSVDGGTIRGDTDFSDKEITKFVAKDYAEDVATTSDSGTSFTSNTLTLDVQDGNVFDITLNDNVTTWAISNLVSGKATTITVILKQDGTGSRLMNATQINSTAFKTVGAGGLTLTTDASAIDIVTVVFDGTNYYVFSQLKMS